MVHWPEYGSWNVRVYPPALPLSSSLTFHMAMDSAEPLLPLCKSGAAVSTCFKVLCGRAGGLKEIMNNLDTGFAGS